MTNVWTGRTGEQFHRVNLCIHGNACHTWVCACITKSAACSAILLLLGRLESERVYWLFLSFARSSPRCSCSDLCCGLLSRTPDSVDSIVCWPFIICPCRCVAQYYVVSVALCWQKCLRVHWMGQRKKFYICVPARYFNRSLAVLYFCRQDIKFKAKSWIDVFGMRGAKAAGAIVTSGVLLLFKVM